MRCDTKLTLNYFFYIYSSFCDWGKQSTAEFVCIIRFSQALKFVVFRPDGDDVTHMPRPINRVLAENSESASQTALPLTFYIMAVQMTTHCKVLLSLSMPSRRSMNQDRQR